MLAGSREALLASFSNDGYLSQEEAHCILGLVDQLKTNHPIVEIGVMSGQTTALLAEYLTILGKPNKVIGIDKFDTWTTEEEVKLRLADIPNSSLIKGSSHDKEVIDKFKDISLLFIDGDHSLEAVEKDIINWVPKVRETVVFHDAYSRISEHQVMEAINKQGLKVEPGEGTIAILKCSKA